MSSALTISKILIANRSEIAARVQTTCHTMGLQTIALYTKEEATASYIFDADQAYQLSLSGTQAYLAQDEIINIARISGADALHPGYGFLAENHEFARKVIAHGLIWIGPHPDSIELMADKFKARECMQKIGVPIVPGASFQVNDNTIKKEAFCKAHTLGFPIIIKCAHGGGGKAMRMVTSVDEFDAAWQRVLSESKNLFNSVDIIIEKYLEKSRHIEVQIAGDGNRYCHFFERECSIQRNHQKITEEAPCISISSDLQEKLYAASVQAAQAAAYNSIGTVEFMVTPNQDFYFLEMNTRLQVEHSVTEMITGIDLINLQIVLAQNKPLPFKQHQIRKTGHAIECRIMAEDPYNNFCPSPGTIHTAHFASMHFARLDSIVHDGYKVLALFDPMIAKITTYGSTRNQAHKRMLAILEQTMLVGINTNRAFLCQVLKTDDFKQASLHTQSLRDIIDRLCLHDKNETFESEDIELAIIATFLTLNNKQKILKKSTTNSKNTDCWKQQQWR